MSIVKQYCILCLLFLLASCKINGSFQGLYSYYDRTKLANPSLFAFPKDTLSICEIRDTTFPKVYLINGNMLKGCIQHTNAVIYIWKPNCSSKVCYSLNLLQELCNKKGLDLFIVAEYFDGVQMKLGHKIERPIFGIDTKYYGSDLTSKYLSEFLYDLTSQHKTKGSVLYFKNGAFFDSYSDVNAVPTSN